MTAKFDRPPVNEVIFSVQFGRPVIDEVGILSKFLPSIADEFPSLEKRPAVPPVGEDFGRPKSSGLKLMAGVPPTRYWFLSSDETLVVQAQEDRVSLNWRQTEAKEPYPGFETLLPRFRDIYALFADALTEHDSNSPTWCELTYINPIEIEPEGDGTHGQLARILNVFGEDPPRQVLPPVEDTSLQQRFRIPNQDDGAPIGRLVVSAGPAFNDQLDKIAYVVTMLTRARPYDDDWQGIERTLRQEHDLIVDGFAEVTTPAMHELWGIRDD